MFFLEQKEIREYYCHKERLFVVFIGARVHSHVTVL